jgi:hypothetical protein
MWSAGNVLPKIQMFMGSNLAEVDGFSRAITIRSTTFLWKGIEAGGPMQYIYSM